jgi:hypothetical protein
MIDEYFLNLIKSDDRLKEYENDLGIGLISKSLDFKINKTLSIIEDEIRELYYPTLESTLLANLMYRVGYLRFKNPLKVKLDVTSNDDVTLEKFSRFTDGQDLYLLANEINISSNTPTQVTLSLEERIVSNDIEIKDANRYFYYDLGATYKDITKVDIYFNNNKLIYSQNFVDFDSEFSIECDINGYLKVVVLLGNEEANLLKNGDILSIETFISSDTSTTPDNMAIIGSDYNIVCNNIFTYENYMPYLSIDEMKNMIKFGRKNIGDICLNEDYRQFILKNVGNIAYIKVWQEREEILEFNNSTSNINKVFVSYITLSNEVRNFDIDTQINNLFFKNLYGKEVVIRDANIVDVSVTIVIKTQENFTNIAYDNIKNNIIGVYDGKSKQISKNSIYAETFREVTKMFGVFELSIYMSDLGSYKNNKFYRILSENISVKFLRD